MQEKALNYLNIKRYVKLANGKIKPAYYSFKANEPRRFERRKDGVYMHYDQFMYDQDGKCYGLACCKSKVIATADTKEELKEDPTNATN